MPEIQLVRVHYADSFAQVLNRVGAPTERLLNQINLSEQMLTVPGGYMPVSQLWKFTALAANYTGLPDIGLMSGMTPLEKHSRFGQNLLSMPTLYQAMLTFCETARTELSNVDFHIKREPGGKVWFCRAPMEGSEDEVRQIESYLIGMMVQVIRWAAGPNWRPAELRLQSPDARSFQDVGLVHDTNIRTGCYQLALGVPLRLTHRRLLHAADLPKGEQGEPCLIPALEGEIDFKTSIKEVIRTHVRAARPKINYVARSLGIPVRTLQRHIANSGSTFSQLVDQTRIETAMVLLEDADLNISDVAREIGYSERPHFSRAFRRITGTTPRQYRADRQSEK
jgi:AraC-like DNA-binding protein